MYTSNVNNNKNFEGRKPAMEGLKETITIEREAFVDACARVMATNPSIREVLKMIPESTLLFVMFGAEVEKELFGEEN